MYSHTRVLFGLVIISDATNELLPEDNKDLFIELLLNFFLNVAARTTVEADPSVRKTGIRDKGDLFARAATVIRDSTKLLSLSYNSPTYGHCASFFPLREHTGVRHCTPCRRTDLGVFVVVVVVVVVFYSHC